MILGSVRASRWSYACAKQLTERYLPHYKACLGLYFALLIRWPSYGFIPGIDGEGILEC